MRFNILLILSTIIAYAGFFSHDLGYYQTHLDDAKEKKEECQKAIQHALIDNDKNKIKEIQQDTECIDANKALKEAAFSSKKFSKDEKRNAMCRKMNDLKKRLDMFKLDNGVYPETEEGFQALIQNPDTDKYPNYRAKPYLKKLPKDSWKTPFVYVKKGSDFEIISFGADRKEGGEESNKDILFSTCNK